MYACNEIGTIQPISKIGKIDLLKVDCEGSEYNILYSLGKNDFKKIKYIVLEYHEFDAKKLHKGRDLSDFLRKNNFTTQIIPTDIKSNQGLGYIYASQILDDKKFQIVFDHSTKSLLNSLRYRSPEYLLRSNLGYYLRSG